MRVVLTNPEFRYNNSTYRIDEIAWDKHPSDEFEGRKNEKISYLKYYADKYNKSIRDPKQPLIVSMPKVIPVFFKFTFSLLKLPKISF